MTSSRRRSTQTTCRGFGADVGDRAGTVITRSTIVTALRPDAATRDCSQARCRQVAEHHFGMGPCDRGVIAPRHHPHVVAGELRDPNSVSGDLRQLLDSFECEACDGTGC
ncbi:hypothetical protein [Modestobacter excelsi]|uniref:hypothetical protein n=1 Tax=Modestobacter excelsi TaxID=2213161 RepID=UPI00110CCA6D|nr:hypothetical protein [Modestobacter excelsi]